MELTVLMGKPGKNGLQGCILRQSEWAKGIEYRNDEALTSGAGTWILLL
ncbi:hypothetical protein NXY15_24655 [Bacteroides thetaiotaomicron]|nr:hypothetical protein NXY15_24655 [Bacteroides thetaiotaomicron]